MTFEIEYFHERLLAEIEAWPTDVLADCARLARKRLKELQNG